MSEHAQDKSDPTKPQPAPENVWGEVVDAGWGPHYAAGNVLRNLRSAKDTLAAARYLDRLVVATKVEQAAGGTLSEPWTPGHPWTDALHKLLPMLRKDEVEVLAIGRLLDLLLVLLEQLAGRKRAASGKFVTIRHRNLQTGEFITMPTPLMDDVISNIPFEFDNAGGAPVTVDPANLSVAVDNAAFGTVALGADGHSVDFTPTQPADDTQVGSISVTDSAASVTLTGDFSLTADQNVARGHFNTAGITTRALGT